MTADGRPQTVIEPPRHQDTKKPADMGPITAINLRALPMVERLTISRQRRLFPGRKLYARRRVGGRGCSRSRSPIELRAWTTGNEPSAEDGWMLVLG